MFLQNQRTNFDHDSKEVITMAFNRTMKEKYLIVMPWSTGKRSVDVSPSHSEVQTFGEAANLTISPWEVFVAAGGDPRTTVHAGQRCDCGHLLPTSFILDVLAQRAGGAHVPFCFLCQTRYLGACMPPPSVAVNRKR